MVLIIACTFSTADISVKYFRTRSSNFYKWFDVDKGLTFCKNITALFLAFGYRYDAREWRLFIDGSSSSLKAVLLHNGNQQPAVPIAYSKTMKETYENLKIILHKINYEHHQWRICADFKVIVVMGLID